MISSNVLKERLAFSQGVKGTDRAAGDTMVCDDAASDLYKQTVSRSRLSFAAIGQSRLAEDSYCGLDRI